MPDRLFVVKSVPGTALSAHRTADTRAGRILKLEVNTDDPLRTAAGSLVEVMLSDALMLLVSAARNHCAGWDSEAAPR